MVVELRQLFYLKSYFVCFEVDIFWSSIWLYSTLWLYFETWTLWYTVNVFHYSFQGVIGSLAAFLARLHDRFWTFQSVPCAFSTVWDLFMPRKAQKRWGTLDAQERRTVRDVGQSETFVKSRYVQVYVSTSKESFDDGQKKIILFKIVLRKQNMTNQNCIIGDFCLSINERLCF